MSVSVTQLIERFLGPSMTSDYTGCFQRGRFTGWFSAPGTDGTYWVVGLGESRDEARRVSRETRAELAELLQGKGVAVGTSNLSFTEARGGYWMVGRPVQVAN